MTYTVPIYGGCHGPHHRHRHGFWRRCVAHRAPSTRATFYRSPPCLGFRRPRHHGVHDEDLDRARLLLHDRCDTRDRAKCQGEVVLLAVDFDGEMKAAAGSSDEGQTHELPDCNISSLAASAFVARRCSSTRHGLRNRPRARATGSWRPTASASRRSCSDAQRARLAARWCQPDVLEVFGLRPWTSWDQAARISGARCPDASRRDRLDCSTSDLRPVVLEAPLRDRGHLGCRLPALGGRVSPRGMLA